MLRGHRSLPLSRSRRANFVALVVAVAVLSACGGTEEPAPDSIAFADDENAATLNGITIVCETDGVTVHSERYEIENIVLSVDGVHTRVDNIFAYEFIVAGAFDRMTIDSDPTIPGDDLPENRIEALWVKAGDNLSADGPGYGQRMACPTPEVEAEREAEETKNYVEHEFGTGAPDDDLAAVDLESDDGVDAAVLPDVGDESNDAAVLSDVGDESNDAAVLPGDVDPAEPDVGAGEPLGSEDASSESDETADAEAAVDAEEVEPEPLEVVDIGTGPQVLGANGAIVLTCGSAGIEVRSETGDLAMVLAFDHGRGEDVRFADIASPSLTLAGDYGAVTALTAAGEEATISCAVASRRADRGPSGG